MNKKMRFLVLGVLALTIIVPFFASAQLIPCGGPGQEACTLCHLFDLAKKIIDTLTTIIAPAIAVLAFTVGGFKILMSGPNPGLRSEGMKAIRNGVIGLLIVFGSWIIVSEFILFFVGSQNVTSLAPWSQITCVPPIPPKTTATTTTTVATGAAYCASNKDNITAGEITGYVSSLTANMAALGAVAEAGAPSTAKIIIAGSGSPDICNSFTTAVPSSGTANCTSVAYLPPTAVTKIIQLQQNLTNYCSTHAGSCADGNGSKLIITGGTECGHQTHGFNQSKIDLRATSAITNYLASLAAPTPIPTCSYITIPGVMRIRYETPACAGGTHYHIEL